VDTKPALIEQLRAWAGAIQPEPAALILFGSTARGEAGRDSDVDVLAVRPACVPFDDDPWTDAVVVWCCQVKEMTGRYVQMLDAGEDEVPALLSRPSPSVWWSIAREGVVLAGSSLPGLATP
jgi:hypothetical protein